LSARRSSGIGKGVRLRLAHLLWPLVPALIAACDVRPLDSRELYGPPVVDASAAEAAATPDGAAPEAPAEPPPEIVDAAAVDAGDTGADASDADERPEGDADTGADGPACATTCPADQYCDELQRRCAPRLGTGMLSGVVRDQCDHNGVDALVGIAGQHQCSFAGKGSYFFTQLPFGKLKLAVANAGYEPFEATVTIVAGGVIQDVVLVRKGGGPGGCGVPAPPQGTCTCTASTCVR
jgi:hypothetical protein